VAINYKKNTREIIMHHKEIMDITTPYLLEKEQKNFLQNLKTLFSTLREKKILTTEETLNTIWHAIFTLPLAHPSSCLNVEKQQNYSFELLMLISNEFTPQEKGKFLLSDKNPIAGTALKFPCLFLKILLDCRIAYDSNRNLYRNAFRNLLEENKTVALELGVSSDLLKHLLYLDNTSRLLPPIARPIPSHYSKPEYNLIYTLFKTPTVGETKEIAASSYSLFSID